ncbi:MAG TPA: TetR/AcrR family transcriptional regulator [Tepidisphaeraceae bacterium]|jgi:AcrR family transcriptional regulator|nr:TetR/AcrR family transcriptional regulator [Tepidisphaeraceae bacterium]
MKSTPATRRYSQGARAQSALDTARRIVGAFLSLLMTQWFDEITLDRVAADAGVTVQTVVRRFGGKEGLLAASVKTLSGRIHAQRATPQGDIARLAANVIADYEQTGDAVIRLLALEPRHPALKQVLDFGRREHRNWVAAAFSQMLGALHAPARERAIDALVTVTDVYVWKLLRRDMGRSVPAATATLKRLIHATITEFSAKPHSGETP